MHEYSSMGFKEGKLKASDRHNLMACNDNRTASLILYTIDKLVALDSD